MSYVCVLVVLFVLNVYTIIPVKNMRTKLSNEIMYTCANIYFSVNFTIFSLLRITIFESNIFPKGQPVKKYSEILMESQSISIFSRLLQS